MSQPKGNVYSGKNDGDYVTLLNGFPFDHEPSLKVRNHSPTGFAWGYWGSGPSQLSLAILLEEVGDLAETYYQSFKEEVIGALPNKEGSSWTLTSQQVYDWLRGHLQRCLEGHSRRMERYVKGSGEWREAQHGWQETSAEIQALVR